LLSIISHKHKQYKTSQWQVFTPRHKPEDTLIGHLTFALKYEGIELCFLEQGKGILSERAKNKEFNALTDEEAARIEEKYREVFHGF